MQKLIDIIDKAFCFDKPYDEYELLEREHGSPRALFGWNERSGKEAGSMPQSVGMNETDDQPANKSAGSKMSVPQSLEETEAIISRRLNTSVNKDAVMRRFKICGSINALLVYMSGMADDERINRFILQPLIEAPKSWLLEGRSGAYNCRNLMQALEQSVVQIGETRLEGDIEKIIPQIVDGMTAVFAEGESTCLLLETRGYEKRAVSSSENEKTVLGPKESFTESLKTNVTLVRRTLRREELVVETAPSGDANKTNLALVYLKGVTDPTLVKEVKNRLNKIDCGTLTDSGMLQQLIINKTLLPVPQVLSTERPDRVCSHVMQGSVGVLLEGSPHALILPVTLFSLINSPEDVYMLKPLGTLQRLVRYSGAIISVLLPGYFLALAMYHQGGLTAEVISTVVSSRKMVFEPIGVEMVLLLLVFQLIREAGLRVPGAIGQAIGIIGGLIMGQAAVAANLASSVVLIIVALSGLGNFCIADYSLQIAASYFRIAVVIAAWLGGLIAIVAAVVLIASMLAGMKSFGVPFLAPYAPKTYTKRPLGLRGELGMHKRGEDYLNTSADA